MDLRKDRHTDQSVTETHILTKTTVKTTYHIKLQVIVLLCDCFDGAYKGADVTMEAIDHEDS